MNLTNNIRKLELIFYTLLVLGIIVLAIYPPSYSRYYDFKNNYLRYKSNFASLVPKENGIMLIDDSRSDEKNATLNFSLTRNEKFTSENDTYILVLPDGCSSNYSSADININNKIHFLANDSVSTKNVEITCNVENDRFVKYDENRDAYLDISVKVNEMVGNDEYAFRYIEYISEDRAYAPLNKVEELTHSNINEINSQVLSIKESFLNKMLNDNKYNDYMEEISSYVNSVDVSSDDFNLLGIDEIVYNDNDSEYDFVINDNFIGYACTYYENNVNNNKNKMIFSTENRDSLNSVFEYYIRQYYASNDDDFYLIMNYMKKNSDISSLILDGANIDGIELENNAVTSININDNFISMVNGQIKDDYLDIYFNNYEYMKGAFISCINNGNLSSPLKGIIINREDIISSIINTEYFENKYFIVDYDNNYVLIAITYNDQYNKISIANIKVEDVDTLNISIDYTNDNRPKDEEFSNIMKFIADEFDGKVEDESLVVENIDENNFSISFKITKNIEEVVDDLNNGTVEVADIGSAATDNDGIGDNDSAYEGSMDEIGTSETGDNTDFASDFDGNSSDDIDANLDTNINVMDSNIEMLD